MSKANGLKVYAEASIPELHIYDMIGPSWAGMVDSKAVIQALAEFGDAREINVRINSPGGSVFEGVAIHNALKRHPAKIIVDIDALCASAAADVAMAGDEIRIAKNAMMMIHRAWAVASGNAEELINVVGLLEKIDQTTVDQFVERTGLDAKEIREMIDAETWMDANEALEKGFVDEITGESKVNASVPRNLAKSFKNVPKHLLSDDRNDHGHSNPSRSQEREFPRIAAAASRSVELRRRLGIR